MSGLVFVSTTELRVSETIGTTYETITRSGSLDGDVTITYGLSGNNATDGADFVGGFFTVVMPSGVDQVQVPVTILDDAIGEPTETLTFSIVNVENATIFAPRTSLISILDDETPAPPPPAEPELISNYDVTQVPVATGLDEPIRLVWSPIDPTKLYVPEKPGEIAIVDVTTGTWTTLLDIRDQVNSYGDRGILDIALPSDLEHNPYLYVTETIDPPDTAGATGLAAPDGGGNRYVQLVRYTLDAATGYTTIVPDSATVLLGGAGHSLADISGEGTLDFTDPANRDLASSERALNPDATAPVVIDGIKQDYWKVDSASHVGGSLAFGPDGALYVGVGDGTSFDYADPRSEDVQNLNSLSGKILRIDPMTGLGLPDNPYVTPGMDLDTNQAKVFQLGLRNPFTLAFDKDGRLFITDTGWNSWEEINVGGPGANFGWPFYEGADNGVLQPSPGYGGLPEGEAFIAEVENGTIQVTPAFRAFAHDSTLPGFQVQSITGGEVFYDGSMYPSSLLNNFFFVDFSGGEVYSVNVDDRTDVKFIYQHSGFGAPTDFVQGPDGYIYYADLVGGLIGRLDITAAQTGPLEKTIGAGPDSLILKISQDAYAGDALYTISVDGVQIEGTLTAKALHGSGQSDTITVLGDWGPGGHTVAVNFLNDAFGGSADTDRNLYVDEIIYNGVPVPGAAAVLATAGPQAFDFTDAGTGEPPPTGTTIGSGPDTLVLKISEDAWNGDAQFTVSVDGVQIGDTLTAHALHSSNTSDTINVLGDWGPGNHTVTITFVNDGWGGTLDTDRNLYVDGISYNGVALPGATAAMQQNGPSAFTFTDTGTAPPPPVTTTVGSGPDTLVLKTSEDAFADVDAQFTVSVDGVQIGGTLSAHALHSSGTSDTINVLGDWATGDHVLSINYVNDGGTARNLYVDSITYDGAAVPGGAIVLLDDGAHDVTFNDPAAPPPPPGTTIGSGPDTLVLKISEDAWNGDAEFTVSVDGAQIGGTLSAHALHSSGTSDTINVLGDWAPGNHTVALSFVNDGWGGTPDTDRNLYVDGIAYNGAAVAGATATMQQNGATAFGFTDTGMETSPPPPPPGATIDIGTGAQTMVLKVNQDAYLGNAQYIVTIDGTQIAGTLDANASHASGAVDTVTIHGTWAAGQHSVAVSFLNDAWGGSLSTDRNLYVQSLDYGTAHLTGNVAANDAANGMEATDPNAAVMAIDGTAEFHLLV